jgi:drug/metabolite transporter, DME family
MIFPIGRCRGQTEPVSGHHDSPPPGRVAVLAVLGAAMLFGTSGTARELGPDAASSLTVGAGRIAIGSVVLWIVVVANRRGEPLPSAAVLRPLRPLVTIGGIGVATYTPLFFVAVDRTGVAVATVVTIASGPFFAAGLDWGFRRVRPTMTWLRGTVVTVAGVAVLIAAVDAGGTAIDVVGVAAALAAGLGYATYSVTSKATMERGLTSTAALAIPFTIGVMMVGALSVSDSWSWLATGSGLVMALYLGVVATGVAYVLFGFGLRRLSTATAVTLVLAEPLTAALLAVVVLDESIPVLGWLGVVAVMAGLVLVGRSASGTPRRTG